MAKIFQGGISRVYQSMVGGGSWFLGFKKWHLRSLLASLVGLCEEAQLIGPTVELCDKLSENDL